MSESAGPERDAKVRESAKSAETHRTEQQGFLAGAGLFLFVGIGIGIDTWHGFQTGKWVDIGKLEIILVPPVIALAIVPCLVSVSARFFLSFLRGRGNREQ